jgi:DNA-binding XRE family transcriptional regulator
MDVKELRYQIARSGLTREDLGKLLGVTKTTIHRRLTGKTEWTLTELQKLKEVLELSDETLRQIFFSEKVS